MKPNTKVMLLDSLNKRIKFLDFIIEKLNLTKIYTIHLRAEEAGRNIKFREQYDVVTARAVAAMPQLVEYMLPLIHVGGKCICMKGSNIDELEESKEIIQNLGGKIKQIDKIKLPYTEFERNIIIIEKIKNTPKQYPRKPNKIRQK